MDPKRLGCGIGSIRLAGAELKQVDFEKRALKWAVQSIAFMLHPIVLSRS